MRPDRTLIVLSTALLLVACGDGANEQPAGGEDSPAAVATEAAAEPTPVVAEHGGTYFGVYLAVGEGPDIEDAINYLTERGLEPGQEFSIGDVSCDQGAEAALGAGAGPMRVAVYFDSQEEAEVWSQTLPAPPIGIAEVQTMCLD